MSVHCLVPLFVSINILTSWFCLDSYKKFTILATTIPEFKTNFWISWSLSSADFDLWEVFLHIYGLTKVFLNFFEGNVSITTFSSFSFLKTPHRRYCKFFSSFLWMGIPSLPDAQILDVLEILKFLILSNAVIIHLLLHYCPQFSLRFSPVESTVFLSGQSLTV